MANDWIPLLEAAYKMQHQLFMIESDAKKLLRSVVTSGRVDGRGEIRERGKFVIVAHGYDANNDPNLISHGGYYYELERYPAEVAVRSFEPWLEALAGDRLKLGSGFEDKDASKQESLSPAFQAIRYAEKALGDELLGLQNKVKEGKIQDFLRQESRTVPSVRTIGRYFGQKTPKGAK